MTGARPIGRAAVHWLTAQAVAFGAMAALLGVVANAMFLYTYGAGWLPATYIAIGVAGVGVSGAIARTGQRFDLLGIALAVLGTAAGGLFASWVVARGGNAPWVSVPLLVLFPILIQLGFVFIGSQAGRILDIAGIKASFPRIMAGFPAGAVVGGVVGAELVTLLGGTEVLLLAAALAQAAFAGLVWATGRRYASALVSSAPAARPGGGWTTDVEPPPPRVLRALVTRFLALILGYQVLSALGSQLADFLVYDRATAHYPDPADLARFLAGYTAVMNAVSIAFLFVLAGPLLRRYGLRLGIPANPLVLTMFAVAMVAVNALAGGASYALLATASAARIADIALTDGTTRTSINATYQVLPERARLSVQTAVEGIGVPVAIGISGALILVLGALPLPLTATIAVTTVVCAVWTLVAILLYRAYGPALVRALRRRPVLVHADELEATLEDEAAAKRLLGSGELGRARLGADLLRSMSSPALAAELASHADDPRPDVRMFALAGLSASGDRHARRGLADEARAAARSADPTVRLLAARSMDALDPEDRDALVALLEDEDPGVRSAALESVHEGDASALGPAIAGLEDARTAAAAAGAIDRLGAAVMPSLAEALEAAGTPAPVLALRLVRAATTSSPARDAVLAAHVAHPDRELGLVVMERLGSRVGASLETTAQLDAVLPGDLRHAARILAALDALARDAGRAGDVDRPLRRALEDELELMSRRVRANRLARYGAEGLAPALVELGAGGPAGALAAEAVSVVLAEREARLVLALLLPGLSPADRLRQLPRPGGPRDPNGWLRDLVEDRDRTWRSPWLRACAVHAARGRGVLDGMDVDAARTLGDPVLDEELHRDAAVTDRAL